MRPSEVRRLLGERGTVVNGWVASGSPYVAEVLSNAGYDCVTVDLQHGMFGPDALVPLLQAISAGPAEPWVRVPALDPAVIGKALDSGAYGVICPSVDSPEQARAFASAMHYPPRGRRSFGAARAAVYGGAGYVAEADDVVSAWAMIESAEALGEVERIAAVDGLTGLYIGPNDLAMSLGVAPGTNDPRLADARARILAAGHAAGLAVGTFCNDAATAVERVAEGFDLVTPMNDMGLFQSAVAQTLDTVRGRSHVSGGY